MARAQASIGPVPFKDVDIVDTAAVVAGSTRVPAEEQLGRTLLENLRCYQGCWLPEQWVSGTMELQRHFQPRPDDVIVASFPKSGTTWVIALTFATMARRLYPPAADAGHPLLRLNPHECLPFLEHLYTSGTEAKLEALPSPRLINTHMPLSILPRWPSCKMVYVCREPKDVVVSLWHYLKRIIPDLTLHSVFQSFCSGGEIYGPLSDHVLGYWRATTAHPDKILFLRYEELLRDPAANVRNLARFLGVPFSPHEEAAGVVGHIVHLCSFAHLQGLEANKYGRVGGYFPRDALFRKGVAGDWANHLTPEMARSIDDMLVTKMHHQGLIFQ